MTIWVLRQSLTAEEEARIFGHTNLILPFDGLPDLTHVTTKQEARQLLNALYPDDPPESISRKIERFWQQFTSLQAGDLIAVPLPLSQSLVLAEITGHYHYRVDDNGGDVHLIPVSWYSKRIPLKKFAKYKEVFNTSSPPLSEVSVPEIRIALRDHLPHGYNRFAKFKWLLLLFFAMSLVRIFMRLDS